MKALLSVWWWGGPLFFGGKGRGGTLTPIKRMCSMCTGRPPDKVTIKSVSLFCPDQPVQHKMPYRKPEPIHSLHSSHSICSHCLSTSPFTPRIASSPTSGPRVPRVCSARRKEVQEAKRVRGKGKKRPEGCSAD